MEMEGSTRRSQSKKLAKKVWSILRTLLSMMKKSGISKANLLIMSFKKAIHGLLLHHHSFLICHPSNHFFSPSKLDYQFSCNNSPTLGPYLVHMAHHHRPKSKSKPKPKSSHLEDPTEMVNTSEEGPTRSPLGVEMGIDYFLPGFGNGKSPMARQLRVTDSPFPLKDGKGEELEEDVKVSKAAEEFIEKFYKNLRMQKSLESPYHMWAR